MHQHILYGEPIEAIWFVNKFFLDLPIYRKYKAYKLSYWRFMAEKPTYEELEKRIQELEQIESNRKQDWASLQESEQRYRMVTEASLQGMYQVDVKRCITFANSFTSEITGYSLAELDGLLLDTLFSSGKAKEIFNKNIALLYSGKSIVGEITLTRQDGRQIETCFSCTPVLDKNGVYSGFIGSVLDITKQKQAENKIQNSKSLLSSIIESPDNIIIFALDTNYNYLSFNNAHVVEMKKVYGADIEIGQCVFSYVPRKDDRLKAEISYKRVLKGERIIEIQKFGKADSRFWYELILNPIINTSNQVRGFTAFITNITDHMLDQLTIKESEKKYRVLAESMNDVIVQLSPTGKLIYVSPNIKKFGGYDSEDEIGNDMSKYFANNTDIIQAVDLLTKVLETNQTGSFKFLFKPKKKKPFYVEHTYCPIVKDNKITAIQLVLRDISERIKADQALKKSYDLLESKVEIRTEELNILNKHLIHVEEKTRNELANDLHDTVAQTLALSVSKIKNLKEKDAAFNVEPLSIIQSYIEQSLIEIRQMINQLCPQILKDFDIVTAIGFLIEETNKKFDADIIFINKTNEPITIDEATKIALYRAVNEIILNILKHSGAKKAKVELKKNKDNIIFKIEDSGIGFDPAEIKITQFNGFGLFSLSRRIINMGGNVKIKSKLNQGTEVKIFIPINQT